jgi:imidazole glycerol-phosphate synthase subunit HisF
LNIKKKIIPRLEIKNGNLIKGIRMEGLKVLSQDLTPIIKRYLKMSVKEIFIEDIVASLFNKKIDFKTIKILSSVIDIPVSYAGGIKNINDVNKLFKTGVDKIYINSALKNNFELINHSSAIYGSQSVGVLVQTRKIFNDWYVFFESGRIHSNIKLKDWVKKIQNSQAGEVIISSIMHDGMFNGPDYELLNFTKKLNITIPIIYAGGIRNVQDVRETLTKKVNSVAISHSLHFQKFN